QNYGPIHLLPGSYGDLGCLVKSYFPEPFKLRSVTVSVVMPASTRTGQTTTCCVTHLASKINKNIAERMPCRGKGHRESGLCHSLSQINQDEQLCPERGLQSKAQEFLTIILPLKHKNVLAISLTPRIMCVVVDTNKDDSKVHSKEWGNSTFCVVSVLLSLHQDWLEGEEFKYRINKGALPAPMEKNHL
ncbi:hypothetical protein U0070_003678, partial [Myodes glareolus]